MTAGKGSKRRPTDTEKFNANFDKIFKKNPAPPTPSATQEQLLTDESVPLLRQSNKL